ncbi:ABC transporter permease [Agrobacterium vitis]|uniref:ABC transporter permease n=1 Tax=Agrobacterium vitis TaxID=373 RepID=UPI000871D958|nr:ABC transporter permease [Agrobacterium vitis]MCE6075642.1 ABC transporter permease subunit [Agrobacterium vitis]MCF1452884.1 ABC transporter permease [Agrobacterium vitis]MCM2450182.1 ABC transporter permease [Agrobacterium vitis]MCM2468120.1 ABC transporter permease [Agrobacterium vitis]MUO70416.1 ABC transporter permease subunit [Agrobacterium vitis]
MLALILRRLGGLVLTLAAVSILIFILMDVLPGDPAAVMLGTSASPDTLAALRHELGLDQPLAIRYLHWLVGALTGDLGQSYTYGVPVAGLIGERLTVTLPLAVMAILLSMAIAIPMGVASASRRNSGFDYAAGFLSQLFIAVPGFWVGLLLVLGFSISLGWMPAGGFAGWQAGFGSALLSLTLPAVALALPQAGVLTRVTRSAVLEVMNEDFVRTARAKGLTRRAALWRHAVPNALVPVMTILGLQFTFLIAGAILIENVFNLPGLGRLAYQALNQRDIIVMQDVVLFFAGLVIIMNFLVDLSYLVLDPRLRGRGK